MKLRTVTLCLPILVISVQQNAVVMTLPPFLDAQRYPVATIGTLLSLSPIFTLAARVPGGMLYRRGRTTARMAIALLVVAATSALYSLAESSALFIVVGALNGFATSIATTLYLPFFIDELPAGQARPQAMGLYTGSIALGFAIGGLGAGCAVDHWGYPAAFVAEGIVALAAIALHTAMAPAAAGAPAAALPAPGPVSARASLRNLLLPEVTSILLAALFLNVLYKIPSTFIPLYGQHAGLSLTDVGLIMAGYALSNAVVRPITGSFVARRNPRSARRAGWLLSDDLARRSRPTRVAPRWSFDARSVCARFRPALPRRGWSRYVAPRGGGGRARRPADPRPGLGPGGIPRLWQATGARPARWPRGMARRCRPRGRGSYCRSLARRHAPPPR